MPHRKADRIRRNRRLKGTVHRLGSEDYRRLQELQDKEFQEAAERQSGREKETSVTENKDDDQNGDDHKGSLHFDRPTKDGVDDEPLKQGQCDEAGEIRSTYRASNVA